MYRYRCHGHIGIVGWKAGAHCYLILFLFYYRDKQKAIKKKKPYIFLESSLIFKNYTKLKSKIGSRYTNTYLNYCLPVPGILLKNQNFALIIYNNN